LPFPQTEQYSTVLFKAVVAVILIPAPAVVVLSPLIWSPLKVTLLTPEVKTLVAPVLEIVSVEVAVA
jgi:hypothetical protein